LQLVWDDVSSAIEADTFEARPDRHLSLSLLEVDERGWGELRDILNGVLDDAERVTQQSRERLARADEKGIPTRLVLMHFEAPS
jgi:hypothetical protein